MTAKYTFFPWLKRGVSTQVTQADNLGSGGITVNGRAEIDFQLSIKRNDDSNDVMVLNKKVGLYGPGDIIGINSNAIIKTEPGNWITNFEPNYFPYIEFYDEDFPWRYTPAAPAGTKLRPWLFLVVLEESEFTRTGSPGSVLPSINLTNPKVLPPQTETWAWAHVRLNDTLATNTLQSVLQNNPDSACSSLICPRKLKSKTGYYAFLIPSFETGRLAGLGDYEKIATTDSQLPSWGASQAAFPVYYEWYFSTGDSGDFEYLVRQIEAKTVDPGAGKKAVYLNKDSYPNSAISQDVEFDLEGALQVPESSRKAFNNNDLADFGNKVAAFLNTGQVTSDSAVPVITPPVYGKWQTLFNSALSSSAAPLTWINELNLDPRNRAVAAFGTDVFRKKKDEYMEIAWQQIDEVNKANSLIKKTQFASKISEKIFSKHLEPQAEAEFFSITSPVHREIIMGNQTLYYESMKSSNAAITQTPALRRIANTSGTMMRRFSGTVNETKMGFAVQKLNVFSAPIKAIKYRPPANISAQIDLINTAGKNFADFILPQNPGVLPPATSQEIENRLNNSVNAFKTNLTKSINSLPAPVIRQALDLTGVKTAMVSSYNNFYSENGFAKNLVGIKINDVPKNIDYNIQVMAYPKIDLPMYKELRDMSLELFFPNIQLIPNNSFTLFETNNRFIESFLVGLNYEMGRELLWQQYPTDQGGSYFRRFWNNNDNNSLTKTYDIKEISKWSAVLGSNPDPGSNSGDHIVFAIRGDLLKKYPQTVIYAAQSSKDTATNKINGFTNQKYPIFTAKVDPDITFVGFDLSETTVKTQDWYFVLLERPGELKFGLDVNPNSQTINGASVYPNDLTWSHVLIGNNENLNYIKIADTKTQLNLIVKNASNTDIWAKDSACMAYIFFQQPVMVAIEATELLGT
jgi:hypothetical protein